MENAGSAHSDLCGNLPPLSSGYEGIQSFTQASCASALLSGWDIYITKMLCQLVLSPQATDCEQVSINEYTPFSFFFTPPLCRGMEMHMLHEVWVLHVPSSLVG